MSPNEPAVNKERNWLRSATRSYPFYLFILSAGTFSFRASTNMFNTNLPLVAKELFNFSETSIGTLVAFVALAAFTSITFVNAKLGTIWRRRLFIFSAFAYCSIFSFVPLVGPLWLWVISISAGFLIQLIMTNQANASGIIGKSSRSRERGIALYTISLSASLLVGPLINSLILTQVPFIYSFAAFAIFPISTAVLALYFPFPKESQGSEVDTPILGEKHIATSQLMDRSFRITLRNPGFQLSLYNMTMYSIPFAAIVSFGGLFSHDYYHASNVSIQLYYETFFAVSFVSRLFLLVSPRLNLHISLAVSSILTIVGVGLMVSVMNPILYVVSMATLGVPHGLTYTSSLNIIARSSSETNRNALNSYFASFSTVITVATGFLVGLISDLVGLRFAFALLLLSISFFSCMLFRKLPMWKPLAV